MELTHAFVLTKCHRFANHEYVNFLRKVSTGTCTEEEFKLMKSSYIVYLSHDERKKFKNSIRICATNDTANEYNVEKLKSLKNPIAIILAQNNNKTAFQSSDDLADGLTNVLSLCIGAKIMLRRNVNVSRGLLPISLCWACTIHKSQGLTLITMALDAGKTEFALGLLYVALSRVSSTLRHFSKRHENKLMNKLYMRHYRSSLSPEKLKKQRAKDNLRKKLLRKNMTLSEKLCRREKEKIYRSNLHHMKKLKRIKKLSSVE
ncbi:ATP-dependent DNA helicase [Frankliniella fusca]|uniref:ATP-dependent DNA helicase n=1 Tax=Frankliniella fusca TaxID=407009 RepID=A0AAE1HE91_9NEOP|nr:ATP-dependent DNA helicase [Frankliniella fusca]